MHAWLLFCTLITLTLLVDASCIGGSPKNALRSKNSPKGSPKITAKLSKRNLSKSSPAIAKSSSKKEVHEEHEEEKTSATDLEGANEQHRHLRVTFENGQNH